MENYLVAESEQGLSRDEIRQALLASLEGRAVRVGIVTNDFHIFRALCIGRAQGAYDLYPVPARSFAGGFVHYAMREFFAVSVSFLRGNMAAA